MTYTGLELSKILLDNRNRLVEQYESASNFQKNLLWNEIGSFEDIREQIHDYQLKNQVSGLAIQSFDLDSKSIDLLAPINSLILLDSDIERLSTVKKRYSDFWLECVRELKHLYFYFSHCDSNGSEFQIETTQEYIESELIHPAWHWGQFLTVFNTQNVFCFEVGYGNPVNSMDKDFDGQSISFCVSKKCELPVTPSKVRSK